MKTKQPKRQERVLARRVGHELNAEELKAASGACNTHIGGCDMYALR